ncbi:MAG: hypothetical protein QOH62_37 [Solirubrobacteraceae bacterium]|jgi:hypothetical protein|nr:hypothetical protein [Solirubrobacteraceae bacterium]
MTRAAPPPKIRSVTRHHIDALTAVAAVGTRLADGAFHAWQSAHIECDLALRAWDAAGPGRSATAHFAYRAALDREEAAARDFEELCRLAGALTTTGATAHVG